MRLNCTSAVQPCTPPELMHASAMIAFSPSPPFDFAANAVARAFTSCTMSGLGARFAQVELHRKIDVCTQLHYVFASCTELHYICTVQSLCNRPGAVVTFAAVAAAFYISRQIY